MSRSDPGPEVLVFYHFFHPDDVVSARHLTDLAVGLARRGYSVEAMPSNRACRSDATYPGHDRIEDVTITRIFRPGLNQATVLGRLINLIWMILAWSFCAFRRRPDVLIVGTDPILSVLVAIPWKLIRPQTRIIHWCFDLYPDAAEASGLVQTGGFFSRAIRRLLGAAYNRCDVIADIGPCMRSRLPTSRASQVTLTPWALSEPEAPLPIDLEERFAVFGDTPLAILYSGNFGEAHSYEGVLALARSMRGQAVFAFSVRGNRVEDLRRSVTAEDTNIRFVEFADEAQLERRLACADIHLVTLKPGWEGIVVPSKFFGALAIGRPVLFDGPVDSAVSTWIRQYGVGVLLADMTAETRLPDGAHCWQVYRQYFALDRQLEHWQQLVTGLRAESESSRLSG